MAKCIIPGCDREVRSKGYCNTHYLRISRYGDPHFKKKDWIKPIQFKEDDNGCFICTSHKVGGPGYPQIQRNHQATTVHRLVYTEMFGEIQKGLVVRHKCDNKLCINPEHLELGTTADNMRDIDERGYRPKGEQVASSRLTKKDVEKIKQSLANPKINTRQTALELMNKYNVSLSTIYDIHYGHTWRHIV